MYRGGEIGSKFDHKIACNHLCNITSRYCFDLQNTQLGRIASVAWLPFVLSSCSEVKYLKLVQEGRVSDMAL